MKLRTLLLIFAVVLSNALGNLSLAWGMRHASESVGLDPFGYVRVMANPAVAGGIFLLVCWLLLRMVLLSWADLSYVLPLTSLGYVLAAVLGYYFLRETVELSHWLGTLLIFAGTILVGSTEGKTVAGCGSFLMKWLLLAVIVVSTVLSDLLQSYEMKRSGEQTVDHRGLAKLLGLIVKKRFLALSIVCMAISFFAFMALVQIAPLSFAVPASAATFVLETILARFVLHEHVGRRRAVGTLLVLGGVILLAK